MPSKLSEPVNKEFVPYKEAHALRNLGYQEDGFAWYGDDKELYLSYITASQGLLIAPLWQQAFHFFRKKCQMECSVYPLTIDGVSTYGFEITLLGSVRTLGEGEDYVSHQKAEIECLRAAIKLISDKK